MRKNAKSIVISAWCLPLLAAAVLALGTAARGQQPGAAAGAAAGGAAASGAAGSGGVSAGGEVAAPPRVRVESGVLAGIERDGVLVFQGVPYAAPPVGPRRWRPPQPPLPWQGERSAAAPGATCMQRPNPAVESFVPAGTPVSEDCLTLQVFAPKGAHGAPVMVWLHGGANVIGAGSRVLYDGAAFAQDGVILVALNYRLGHFGFFTHAVLSRAAPAGEPVANFGLLDQIAGLGWVARNIAAFGGDPRRVTVFGESAGGGDLLALMSTPAARGLFAQAIAESPGGGWEPLPTMNEAEAAGERTVAAATRVQSEAVTRWAAGVVKAGGVDADVLRALPAEALVAVPAENVGPVIDGRLLKEGIAQAFAGGHALRVPLILGCNSFEASLLPDPAAALPYARPTVRAAYTATGTDTTNDKTLGAAIFGDHYFVAPERWFARTAAAQGAPAWLYYFSYVRVHQRGKVMGASHGSELPYVFNTWDKLSPLAAMLPAEDRAMTRLVHNLWVQFAKTGQPAGPSLPAWPAYTADGDQLLELGTQIAVRQHFRQHQLDAQERAAWDVLPASHPAL